MYTIILAQFGPAHKCLNYFFIYKILSSTLLSTELGYVFYNHNLQIINNFHDRTLLYFNNDDRMHIIQIILIKLKTI
jgi:hypothetical protein